MKKAFSPLRPLAAAVALAMPLLFTATVAQAGFQLQVPVNPGNGGGNNGNGAGATNKFFVLQLDSVGGSVSNLGLQNTCPAGGLSAPFLVNPPGTQPSSTYYPTGLASDGGHAYWASPYYDPSTGGGTGVATVCVPAKSTDTLASASYSTPVYDSGIQGGAVFSGWAAGPTVPGVSGVIVRVTTSAGTYRIHMLSSMYLKCSDGTSSCVIAGTGSQPASVSHVSSIGAELETGGATADFTYQTPYVPYGVFTPTGTATITIPAAAITTLQ